jgi:hypothetical protein
MEKTEAPPDCNNREPQSDEGTYNTQDSIGLAAAFYESAPP